MQQGQHRQSQAKDPIRSGLMHALLCGVAWCMAGGILDVLLSNCSYFVQLMLGLNIGKAFMSLNLQSQ